MGNRCPQSISFRCKCRLCWQTNSFCPQSFWPRWCKFCSEILRNELDKAMHLAGCNSIREIGPHLVQRDSLPKI
ncbi:hypothetical protein CEXT_144371 [Caerostris extrusa]|uniref:Uncharacterized protein n=1 Tax=Caerostris extrusa TaxID=172846 RepID=A0AAV4YAL8_CAEEX|nr:hypothetical protein CEXT_144371 [Caerostris extrusa]